MICILCYFKIQKFYLMSLVKGNFIMKNSYKGYQSITSKAMKAEMLEQDVELELARNWHQNGCEKSLHRLVNA